MADWTLHEGDCLEVMATLPAESVDAVVTDPPYELGFMGQAWDRQGIAYRPELWSAVLRLLKPGGHLLAFGGTRTYHRLACAIEDAGFEVRDCLMWLYGSGFPKYLDVSKAIDKHFGAERTEGAREWRGGQREGGIIGTEKTNLGTNTRVIYDVPATFEGAKWQGWGTALKPAYEPIILARKPLSEPNVAANVLKWGTGALNIDGCRIPTNENRARFNRARQGGTSYVVQRRDAYIDPGGEGRFPANILLDEEAAKMLDGQQGGASRFFYVAKASRSERTMGGKVENNHPTVKPIKLMRYLCRLITPPDGTVLDPFAGSGTTLLAAVQDGFSAIGIEREPEYCEIIRGRMAKVQPPLPLVAGT